MICPGLSIASSFVSAGGTKDHEDVLFKTTLTTGSPWAAIAESEAWKEPGCSLQDPPPAEPASQTKLESPISTAIALDKLLKSDDPGQRQLAEILDGISGLHTLVDSRMAILKKQLDYMISRQLGNIEEILAPR